MLRNPIAILADDAYRFWMRIRDAIRRFKAWLFPRKEDLIYGVNTDGTIVGKITFAARNDAHRPIHHLMLELWGRTRLGRWRKLGQTTSSKDGSFALGYDIEAVTGLGLRSKLKFEICHSEGMVLDENGKSHPVFELFETIPIKKSSLVCMRFNLGTIQLHYWEYRTDTPLPRTDMEKLNDHPPQKYSQGRMDAITEQFIPVELETKKLKRHLRDNPDSVTIDHIQEVFPVNLSMGLDHNFPGVSRSDEYFGVRMMNGVYSNIFDRWPDDNNTFWVHYHWSSYEHTNDEFIFPDVTCKFKLDPSQYLRPTEIVIRGALVKGEPESSRRVLTPADGDKWQAAKRIARVQAALTAQVDKHYVGTHVNVEQYALPIHRNLQRNPIAALYYPHLKGITLINHTADKILVNPNGYVPRTSALTGNGLAKRCVDTLGTLDWKNFRPLQPISEKHFYAKVANLYWDILHRFVGEYIEQHKDEIIEEWHEIYSFSQELVRHSVPLFLCNYLSGRQNAEGSSLGDWYSNDGRMDLKVKRVSINGETKAVSPLTNFEVYDPQSDDMDQLHQISTYIIYQASFGHFWSNFQQYDDIGELKYSTLGLGFGSGPDGALGPESDDAIAPSKELCIETMWWANMLSRTGYGFIMKNEDGDIHPRLIELMKEHEWEFEKYQFNIYDLQSRTNI